MRIVLDELISWQYLICVLVFIFFILWLFFGGRDDVEFIGFKPLAVGKDVNGNSLDLHSDLHDSNNSNDLSQDTDPIIEISYIDDTLIDKEDILNKENMGNINNGNILNQDKNGNNINNGNILNQDKNGNILNQDKNGNNINNGNNGNNINNGNINNGNNCRTSKGELLCKRAIEDIYGDEFYTVRPDFLKNPETKRNLELDLYNENLKIAIEYNGEQHYVFPNCFHKTETEFINQVRRDEYKKQKCKEMEIHLISVPYTVPKNYIDIKKFIMDRLPI